MILRSNVKQYCGAANVAANPHQLSIPLRVVGVTVMECHCLKKFRWNKLTLRREKGKPRKVYIASNTIFAYDGEEQFPNRTMF